jgi:hypothetical protein
VLKELMLFLLLASATLNGPWAETNKLTAVEAELLVYRVTGPDGEPRIDRLLANDGMLRLDQGVAGEGFILFDSAEKIIYSVDENERTVLVIKPRWQWPKKSAEMTMESRRVTEEKSPKVVGVEPEHWEFYTGDRLCRSAIVLPGVMPDAVGIYADYLQQHGLQQQSALDSLPEEFRDACELLNQVYYPAAALAKGLPLRIWALDGEGRELVDFRQDFSVSSELFKLPQGFRKIILGEQ